MQMHAVTKRISSTCVIWLNWIGLDLMLNMKALRTVADAESCACVCGIQYSNSTQVSVQ